MEHDDIVIGIAKLQSSQDEILRRLADFKEDLKDTKQDLAEVRKYMYYAGGVLTFISATWPFVWDYVKFKLGWASA